MFGTLDSMSLLASIAREMIRVTKPGGYIMLADWRYQRRGSGVNTAISKATVKRLFRVGESTDVIARERGALVPPLGKAALPPRARCLLPSSSCSSICRRADHDASEAALTRQLLSDQRATLNDFARSWRRSSR